MIAGGRAVVGKGRAQVNTIKLFAIQSRSQGTSCVSTSIVNVASMTDKKFVIIIFFCIPSTEVSHLNWIAYCKIVDLYT